MATSTRERLARGPVPVPAIPTLEPGDRLTRDEFERRYAAMPALKKAELIAGVVYIPSPVRVRRHGGPHAKIITWLGHDEAKTPGIEVADNATARLDLENEPQPDARHQFAHRTPTATKAKYGIRTGRRFIGHRGYFSQSSPQFRLERAEAETPIPGGLVYVQSRAVPICICCLTCGCRSN